MSFRDELEAARARQQQLESELAAERARRSSLESALAAQRDGVVSGRPPVPLWLPLVGALLALALFSLGVPLGASALANREVGLTWSGRLVSPGQTGLPEGTACLLRVRPNVQWHKTLVGEWRVSVRCGRRSLLERAGACCMDEPGTDCGLHQSRRLGAAFYRVQCRDRGLAILSDESRLAIGSVSIQIERDSAPLAEDPLFDEDGWTLGFREYEPD